MSDLPDGWEWAALRDLGEWFGGGTPSKRVAEYWSAGTIPWLSPKDMTSDVLLDTKDHVSESAVENSATRRLPGGSVAVVVRSGILERKLPVAIVPFSTTLNQDMRAVYPHRGIDPRWIAHYLRSIQRDILQNCSKRGTTVASIDSKRFMDLRIPVPPVAEQQRIIAVLEDHLTRLDMANLTIYSALSRAGGLRKAAIAALIEGLSAVPIRPLSTLLREPLRNGYSGKATDSPNGVRTLTLTAVTKNMFVDAHTKLAHVEGRRIDDLWLEPGDIFVQRSNAPELVGTSALYVGKRNWAIFPDLLIRVRVNSEIIPEYAQIVISSAKVRAYLKRSAKGLSGSMPKIDQEIIGNIQIPVPAVDVQRRVIQQVNALIADIDRLQAELDTANRRGRLLRGSLLSAAFAGQLMPQEPSDELAAAVLGRIRADRAASPAPKVKRPGRTTKKVKEVSPVQEPLL